MSNKELFKTILEIPLIIIKKLYDNLVKKLRFSITFKITVIYSFMLTLILLVFIFGIWGTFLGYINRNIKTNMEKDFALISFYMKNSAHVPTDDIDELSNTENISISIFDENFKLLYTTEKNSNSVTFYKIDNKFSYKKDTINQNKYDLIFSNKLIWNSNNVYIQFNNKLSNEYTLATSLIIVLLILTIIFIIISSIIGSKNSKKMLLPVEKMTKTVKNITINVLDTRLDVSGSKDELKDLAETFNNMLDRIQKSYEQQNQFVSDASHELRTPISVIQGYANLLDRWGKTDKEVLDESITAIKSEAESMKDLIEKLLFLARGDKNTQKIDKQYFHINELIDEVIKETKLIDNAHNICNDKNEAIEFLGDRKLLKEALRIFIDNSIKYTPQEGKITLNSYQRKNQLLITIEDTGIGIAKEDLPNIFNRFYRADKSRTKGTGGTGLGLSIAKWIVLKHRGSINIQSKLNVGTKITLYFPI